MDSLILVVLDKNSYVTFYFVEIVQVVLRANLHHPLSSLFLCGLILSLWCFSILVSYHFQVSFNLNFVRGYGSQTNSKCDD